MSLSPSFRARLACTYSYRKHMRRHELENRNSSTLAACIIEPILQGANGMRMIDPLFQRVLVEACR